eukprot:15364464-Ditylum_brightwellii.AAC.2
MNIVSWEDECFRLKSEKEDSTKRCNSLELSLRQAHTRYAHLESTCKQKYNGRTHISTSGVENTCKLAAQLANKYKKEAQVLRRRFGSNPSAANTHNTNASKGGCKRGVSDAATIKSDVDDVIKQLQTRLFSAEKELCVLRRENECLQSSENINDQENFDSLQIECNETQFTCNKNIPASKEVGQDERSPMQREVEIAYASLGSYDAHGILLAV